MYFHDSQHFFTMLTYSCGEPKSIDFWFRFDIIYHFNFALVILKYFRDLMNIVLFSFKGLMILDKKIRKKIKKIQRGEITGHYIYKKLAHREKDSHNKDILTEIANDELNHYNTFKNYTNVDVKPSKFQMFIYTFMAIIFGLTFSLKLMERLESKAITDYSELEQSFPEIVDIIKDEEAHEKQLLDLINEKKLNYIGSVEFR